MAHAHDNFQVIERVALEISSVSGDGKVIERIYENPHKESPDKWYEGRGFRSQCREGIFLCTSLLKSARMIILRCNILNCTIYEPLYPRFEQTATFKKLGSV